MPPKKKNAKPQKSAIDKDFRLQAVILADSYQARFQPLTKDYPRCLLPLANTPLLEYTFEFLAKAGVCEVFLMCCSHADKIEDYIKQSKWSGSHSPFEIHTKKLTESMSVGDAMRDLDAAGSITSDFLLVSGDVVSNIDFTPVLEDHLQRKQDDKNAMMTMVLRQADAFHRTRSRIEPGLFVLNDKTSECLRYEELSLNNPTGSIDLDGELLNDDATLSIRNDLIDCHIDLCSIDVLAQFTENFDYSTLRSDFVKNILTSEILGKKIYAHIVTDAYAARVRSLQTYSAVTKDIVSRYSYPVVPDSNLMDDQTFSYQMGHIYKEKGVVLAQSCVLGSRSLVGQGTSLGERSMVKDTVIGRDCKIATNVNLVDSFIWGNVTIEDDVTVNGGLVADGAILRKGCSVGPGSIIGHGVTVEEGQKVEGIYLVLENGESVPFDAVDEDDSDFDTDDEFNANVGSLVYNLKELNLSDTSINDHCYEDDENIRAVAPKKKTRRRLSSTVSNVSDNHEDEFQKEAIASLDRAFQENHEIDIAALELGTLRMSSNVPYEEVRAASVKAINGYITRVLNMGVTDDHKVPTKKVWGKWAELFEKQVFEPADQVDLLNILLKDCSRRPVGNYILYIAAESLYDADVLDEHVIIRWWHQQPEDVSPEVASVRTLLGKWINWLEEADSESDEDESDSVIAANTVFVWPSTTRNKAKYTGYGPPNYSRERLNSNTFSESYSNTTSSVSLNTDYRQHLGFTSSRYRNGGNECCSSDQECYHNEEDGDESPGGGRGTSTGAGGGGGYEKHNKLPPLPKIDGYAPLVPIVPQFFHSNSVYRSVKLSTGQPVLVTVSAEGTLEDLIRVSYEWQLLRGDVEEEVKPQQETGEPTRSDSFRDNLTNKDWAGQEYSLPRDLAGILRPSELVQVSSEPPISALIFDNNEKLMTLREKFLDIDLCEEEEVSPIRPLKPELDSSPLNPLASSNGRQKSPVKLTISPATANGVAGTSAPTPFSPTPFHRTKDEILEILRAIVSVLTTIAAAHEHNITHHGLNPGRIFLNEKGETFISSWDFSFCLRVEDPAKGYRRTHIKQMGNNMYYVSPETTGEMNRLVDFRADFYSIGCILYELLIGSPPFKSADPLELGYMHVSCAPVAPQLLASWVPEQLGAVVMKLLEKNSDSRYQTAESIISDLEYIYDCIDKDVKLDSAFVPASGSTNVLSRFLVPQLIYGRDSEITTMSTVYEKLLEKGCAQMIVVRGDPGIGKSRLVYELEKSVIARHGYFAMAKFDQYQRVPPFYTTITILNDLIHQLLSASQTTILNWRERILTNIKVDMSVLFGPIPELRQLVGPDYHDIVPEGPPLGPVKRELRIKYLVKSLFCLFGVFGLAIFLDDIQWCFPTDFEFFVELQSFAKENHFDDVRVTLVCSAICNDDPLASKCNFLLDIIKQTDAPFVEIALQPLAKEAVRQIIAQTLSIRPSSAGPERRASVSRKSSFTYDTDVTVPCTNTVTADPQVESLTDTVYRITEGNPLFISCLLRYLYYRGYIYLDQNTRGGNSNIGKWKVDFDMLLSHTLPRSVQETTISMYESLPPLTYKIIRYAACICSNTFTLEDLALSLEISFSEAAEALYPALEVELILPTTLHYKFPFSKADGELNLSNDQIRQIARQAKYRFYHDLVQQSVYFHIDDNEKAEIHRQIGLRLLGKHDAKKMPAHKVLEIATQLRKALTIVRDDEKIIYRDLNIQAGHLVFDMTDFDMAFRFFDVAKKLLPPDPWEHHEAITRDIYLSLMELQFLRKKHQSCLELIDQVFPHCTDIMDQAQCLKTKVKALSAVKKKDAAIAASLEVLALLGFHLQEDEEWNEKNYSVLRHRIPLSVGEIRDLAHNPVTKDVRMLLAHEVIFITLIPVLLSNRKHFIRSLTLVAVTAFLDYGSSSVCAFSLLTLASHFQKDGGSINLTRAYEYSKLAIVTLECDSTVNLDFGMNTYEYYVLTLAIYFEPLSEVIRYYDIVMKTGQTIYDPHGTVAFSLGLRPMCKFLAGESLQSIHTMFVNLEASTTQLDHRISRLWLKIHTQAILNLMGDGHNDPSCLEGELLGNKEDVEEIMSSKAEEVQYAYNVCRLLLAVVYKHKYVASGIILHDLKYTMTTLPVTVYHVIVTFYGALAIIDSEGRYSEESEPLLEQFARDLEDWSATCPSTFLHKHLCIKAELHKHTCDSIITLDTYEEAIQAALKEGFLQDAAVINERCGDWLQTHSKNRSVAYYQEAAKFYGAWGARLKVNQLVHKYPEIQSSNYELNHLTLLTNTSASSNAYYSDLRARSSLISNSVLVQSPLRWILSSLLREEENKEQIPGKDMTPNALQALAVNDETEMITSPLIMQGIGAGKAMNQQEENAGRIVLDHNTKHTQMLKGKKTDEQDVKSALQACLDISEAIDTTSIVRKLIESVLVIGGADYAVFISLDDDGGLYVDSVGVLNTITQIRHEPLISRSDLAPMSVIQHVLITGTPISRQADTRKFDTVHGRDHFFYNRSYQSVLCMPIQNQIKSVGILYLEHQHNFRVFSLQRIELISLLCTQAAVSMEKARLYHQMDLAKKAAEEATAEKASFLANMSHEIRTPFNALLSCSIFLMDTNLTVVQREYVDTIRSSAMLTLNIIDAILAFSKIEHGSIDLENSPFSLRECIESAIQLVAEPAATKDLELVHLNRCGEVDIVNGDVTRFRQIVINLVGNAVKFTSKGYIVVESHAERVSSDHRYEFVISVTDTGIGIPKNARDKVFRAFSQVDGSARRVFGGSGLGLAISKKLAELMGGGLTFDSVEGEGTTFWFSLVARAQEPTKDKVSLYDGKKVILADSHAMEKESLHTELERLGFEITCCDDSSEARKIVLENPPNTFVLVFIDARSVPDESNDLHDISRASPVTKCLLMSHFGVPMAEDFQEQGYSAILMRPIQRSRLADIIKRLLDDQTPSDAKKALKNAPNEKGMLQSLAERHPLKILLAEDNIINTRVALQHLKRMGYNAEHAKDGVEVLRMCQREIDAGRPMYDCVLMDIQMPNKDGIAASQELKELYKDDCPNVIALTANAGGEDRRKCLDAGMVSYLAKPILPADLAAVLMSVQVADTKKVASEDK